MKSTIVHVDFNSYFATIEQQANPRLRGKPVGITGGDRMERTVLSTASIEAKRLGVKTGMQLWEAKKVCPQIIIISGDADKYLECSKRFWNILKDYSPFVEIFSIDEAFLKILSPVIPNFLCHSRAGGNPNSRTNNWIPEQVRDDNEVRSAMAIALEIKQRIRSEIGEWVTCSIGISYNKLMAKLASDQQKPDGLVVIQNQEETIELLDKVALDDICGIGPRIKKRLFNLGITDFKRLRQVPKELLLASFKSYGEVLYNMARGVDYSSIVPFYDREEVKSIAHRHTIFHDTSDPTEIKQILLKICEMIAIRLRTKKLVGKTVHCWYRSAFPSHPPGVGHSPPDHLESVFAGDGKQFTLGKYTSDGLEIFEAAWQLFHEIWYSEKIRMVGASISNLKPVNPHNLSWLPDEKRKDLITKALDKVNNKHGDFTLRRGTLLKSTPMSRKPNPFLSDRRFKI